MIKYIFFLLSIKILKVSAVKGLNDFCSNEKEKRSSGGREGEIVKSVENRFTRRLSKVCREGKNKRAKRKEMIHIGGMLRRNNGEPFEFEARGSVEKRAERTSGEIRGWDEEVERKKGQADAGFLQDEREERKVVPRESLPSDYCIQHNLRHCLGSRAGNVRAY